jgi:predicted O-methyltransferase YrrM
MSERDTWSAVERYWDGKVLRADAALTDAVRDNAAAGLPPIDVAPAQGKLLMLLARSIGARAILEVGTLGGYSTIWLARALPADGRLVTVELEPRHAEVARANLARAGVADRVEVRVGRGVDVLAAMEPADGEFDLVFIDADKASNTEYVEHAVRLARPGAMVVVDNVVRDGRVADPASTDAAVLGTRRMADAIERDERLDATVIQTVGGKAYDGFLLALVQ